MPSPTVPSSLMDTLSALSILHHSPPVRLCHLKGDPLSLLVSARARRSVTGAGNDR